MLYPPENILLGKKMVNNKVDKITRLIDVCQPLPLATLCWYGGLMGEVVEMADMEATHRWTTMYHQFLRLI